MSNDFMKLTSSNQKQSQIDALKKIGEHSFGVNGGRIVFDGTDLSVFQGDINNFEKTHLGGYDKTQLDGIFGALDVNGDGNLDMNELQAFASMGSGNNGVIANDKNIIDESDFQALYEMAQGYVEEALEDDSDLTNTKPTTNNYNVTSITTPEVNKSETKKEVSNNTKTQTEVSNNTEAYVVEEPSLSNNDVLAAAAELRTAMKGLGTDEATVNKILLEKGYSSADIVRIMDTFEKEYGETLMSDIQGDFSGREETPLRECLYDAASREAAKAIGWQSSDDIPEDIVRKANDFYAEFHSADATGYMKNFDKLSDLEKSQILIACDTLHPDEKSISRITEGRVWFGQEDKYVNNIISALKNTALNGPEKKI